MNQTEKRESASIGKVIKNATKFPLTSNHFSSKCTLSTQRKSCIIKFYLLDQLDNT